MAFTEEEKAKIVGFLKACDEMIKGRFILSDTKVVNILKAIVGSEILYTLYSKCMKNFKFGVELEKAKASNPHNGGYFVMPTAEKEIVAFVTCFLLEVDKKNINLQSFVTDNFFSPDGYNISYNNFSLSVLVVYKNTVMNMLGIDESGKEINPQPVLDNQISISEEQIPEKDDEVKILFANLIMTINELYSTINEDYRMKFNEKEELLIILKAFNKAVQLEELLIINALLVPLEHSLGKNKKYKNLYDNLKILIADIYY